MHKHHHQPPDKGGSQKGVHPGTNVPQNESVPVRPANEKHVGIGMPVSKEEMDRLKEEATKMDR